MERRQGASQRAVVRRAGKFQLLPRQWRCSASPSRHFII